MSDREAFVQRLDTALRAGEGRMGFAILMVDAGETPAEQTLQAIRSSIRFSDSVAMLDAHLFAVLLAVGNEAGAQRVAGKILESLSPAQASIGGTSIGIALFPTHGTARDALWRAADAALYQAKRNRRGMVMAVAGDESTSAPAPELRARIGSAVAQDEFVLRFQPVVELGNNVAIAAEALVRWRHPELGLLPPARFLQFVEGDEAGRFALHLIEHALQQMRAWRDEGFSLPVSINLDSQALALPTLEEAIVVRMHELSLPPESFTLELRDDQLMQLPAAAMKNLYAIAAAGIRLSIDDFGRGAASLHVLRDLPVDEIKLDPQLTAQVVRNQSDATIVASLIQLGQTLGKRVVAKNVEQEDVLDRLHGLGCRYAQGFVFAQALEPEAICSWRG